jgi:hypothetical protein
MDGKGEIISPAIEATGKARLGARTLRKRCAMQDKMLDFHCTEMSEILDFA